MDYRVLPMMSLKRYLTDDALRAELVRARRGRGLTQAQVAELMGVSQPVVAALESRSQAIPKVGTLQRYAQVLDLEVRHELVQVEYPRWEHAPEGVKVYASTDEFIREDPSRENHGMGVQRGDLAGWDAGKFTMTDTHRGVTGESIWHIGVHGREVHAVLRRFPGEPLYTFQGPVWLIGTVPERMDPGVASPGIRAITDHADYTMKGPESLVEAVEWIRESFRVVEAYEAEATANGSRARTNA